MPQILTSSCHRECHPHPDLPQLITLPPPSNCISVCGIVSAIAGVRGFVRRAIAVILGLFESKAIAVLLGMRSPFHRLLQKGDPNFQDCDWGVGFCWGCDRSWVRRAGYAPRVRSQPSRSERLEKSNNASPISSS